MREPRPIVAHLVREAVPIIIAVNAAVFLLWMVGRNSSSSGLFVFLAENFTTNWEDRVSQGRIWTLLTAAFSHAEFWHLLLNMFILYSFGTLLESQWGTRTFWLFYLGAAVVASAISCGIGATPWWDDPLMLGASGAISGLLICFSLLYPRHTILLFFIVPVPAIAAAAAFVGWDVWGLLQQQGGGGLRIGHGAHLGGALSGALFYLFYLRPGRHRRRQRRVTRPRVVSFDAAGPESESDDQRRLDSLLTKISRQGGTDCLTPEERDFMIRMSEKMRRGR